FEAARRPSQAWCEPIQKCPRKKTLGGTRFLGIIWLVENKPLIFGRAPGVLLNKDAARRFAFGPCRTSGTVSPGFRSPATIWTIAELQTAWDPRRFWLPGRDPVFHIGGCSDEALV